MKGGLDLFQKSQYHVVLALGKNWIYMLFIVLSVLASHGGGRARDSDLLTVF